MKAIVFVFMPAGEAQSVKAKSAALRVADLFQPGPAVEDVKVNLQRISERKQAAPPFWTWFIENPRLETP